MQPLFRDRADGFSLIEVLVALAIVCLMLGTAAAVFRNGLAGHAAAGDVDAAIVVAEATIAAAGVTQPLHEGQTSGRFDDRFAWRLAIAPYEDAANPSPSSFRLYRLEVEVSWSEGLRQRRISLDTLRLAATP